MDKMRFMVSGRHVHWSEYKKQAEHRYVPSPLSSSGLVQLHARSIVILPST